MSQEHYCKYHVEIPAKWYCVGCKIALCSHCVLEDRQSGKNIVCPACDKVLRKLSTAHAIPPFWKRMPATFAYPFNGGSLAYLIGISLFSLLFMVPLMPVVIVASLVLPLMILRYGFSVLQHTAMGHPTPPKMSINFKLSELALPIKFILIIVLIGALIGLILFPLGISPDVIQMVAFILTQLVLPAMIVLLAVHNSFFQAINPIGIGNVIATVGLPYLALCGVLLLLSGAPSSVMYIFGGIIPEWMIVMFSIFVTGYFTIINFYLMGYVVYQFHEHLGIKPEVEYGAHFKVSKSQKNGTGNQTGTSYAALQKVRLLIKEGMQQAAKATLQKELQRHAEMDNARIEMHQLYHQMLINNKESEAAIEHANSFIPALLDENMGKQAIAVFRDCIEIDPQFRLTTPEDIHKLATAAQKADEHKIILSLINGFVQKHPEYPDAIELLLMAAQSLQHHFRQDEKAKKILQYIIKRYPDDARMQKAKRDLMLMDQSAGIAT